MLNMNNHVLLDCDFLVVAATQLVHCETWFVWMWHDGQPLMVILSFEPSNLYLGISS